MRKRKPVEERFWSKVALPNEAGCMLWKAALPPSGYGKFTTDGVTRYAHRMAYEWLVGPIPDGFQIDHLCRVRNCVAPDHLEAVTQQENLRRGEAGANNKIKTHCPHGHEYTPENTLVNRSGSRVCVICKRVAARLSARRVRARKRQKLVIP